MSEQTIIGSVVRWRDNAEDSHMEETQVISINDDALDDTGRVEICARLGPRESVYLRVDPEELLRAIYRLGPRKQP